MSQCQPLVLLILDGWGHREAAPDNAISTGCTPNWDRLWTSCPHALLDTAGEAVGLPEGQMGNSEVGHLNIGAGRIVYQELTRIGKTIADGSLADNPALSGAVAKAREHGSCVHIMGLLSPGGVHSHEDHLLATLAMSLEQGAPEVAVHAFLDGRDMPPRSAEASIQRLEMAVADHDRACVASVSGRYYAMDRDKRWERTRAAWDAIVEAKGEFNCDTASEALSQAYGRGEDDEFVKPTVIGSGRRVEDQDVVIFINFRADRARQLTSAFVSLDFDGFQARRPALASMVTMTRYQEDFDTEVAFAPSTLEHLLGAELSAAGMRQLRIAETEKYAHVTYFFNGGEETVFDGEERRLIPSPDVATYDLQPEMSAPRLSDELVAAIESGTFDVIVCNVANPDMVGHSGVFEAAVQAVEAVDQLLGRVDEAVRRAGGEMLVTADHGNVEQMSDPENHQPHTSHTTNPVPFLYVGPRPARLEARGSLRDIAPTMLSLLDLEVPEAMTGRPLVDISQGAGD
ncbi:2,3-bisphosphoglycerate-independent phosphoglycerate mutase [Wenzhouxiangella sp. AB-CW3]|uniref:2,3-bisphosphoglycerate-independent phosphoglycerate mutase n=1 Tax=Wenzhouxiangella sp. AB-CW3 TaxID=2771012 RepID=UPI00168B5104|nr:2,3-bisphosphoglycerate-independent phosphoglycerate mutase [Wenzhouxiangella sp. AB-CW3]QOC24028.1 2,3-bisphosphoglycerate-independent phosphoglycerate mutase [Wenzhouxiangella sp. AB-CW3]